MTYTDSVHTPSPHASTQKPDFYRNVYCLLGIPFDVLTMDETISRVDHAIQHRTPCFLATPNLNVTIGCLQDVDFRDSVIHSNLSVADGMPLVWLSRLLGIPMRERIAGSTLFERLNLRKPAHKITVYFFGGMEGVAHNACEHLNLSSTGLQCQGAQSPGFGSLAELSSEQAIADINSSRADFLVVSLSAKKGHAWIMHNRHRLYAPVISHLGAVVNFVAGTVERAPEWTQRLGLEWLWRIKEEPGLWQRYAYDGGYLLRLLVTRVLPATVYQALFAPRRNTPNTAQLTTQHSANRLRLTFSGAWHAGNLAGMRHAFDQAVQQEVNIELDLAAVTYFDHAAIALIMLLAGYQHRVHRHTCLHTVSKAVRLSLRLNMADFLLNNRCAPASPPP